MSIVGAKSPIQFHAISGLKSILQTHPLISYFILAFVGTWLLDAPMVLGQDGLGLFPFKVPQVLYILLFLLSAYSGPTLAALLTIHATEGKAGVKAFFKRYRMWRVGIRWYFIALLAYPLLYVTVGMFWLGIAPLQNIAAHWPAFFVVYLPGVLILPGVITWGEEAGWRGYGLTRMQDNYGALRAALVVGFLHGIWHLPAFLLVNGPVANGPFNLSRFSLSTGIIMVVTIIWTCVFNNVGQSILIAVLLHASSDAVQPLMRVWIPNFPKPASYMVLVSYILIALILIVVTRGRLSYRQK